MREGSIAHALENGGAKAASIPSLDSPTGHEREPESATMLHRSISMAGDTWTSRTPTPHSA